MWNEGVTDLHIYILSILQDNFRFVGVTKVVKNKKRNQYGLGNFEEIYLFIIFVFIISFVYIHVCIFSYNRRGLRFYRCFFFLHCMY